MFVFLFLYVMFNILLSIFVCAASTLFMGGECPCSRAVCHCWKYPRVVDLSLQACFNVTYEDVAVLGECCLSGCDSSLNLLVLFCFISVAVSLSQVDVAFNVLDLSVVDIFWCVCFHHHLCLRLLHLQTLIVTFIS